MNISLLLLAIIVTCFSGYVIAINGYYGKLIGEFNELVDPIIRGVTGKVYAVNEKTLYIKDFIYDGSSDDVFFYASGVNFPDDEGFKLQDWDNDGYPLRKYNKEGVALSLPANLSLNDVQMVYVWNERLKVSLGHIVIPKSFDYPKPKKIGALKGVHAISSGNIIILDMQTILIPHLYYHGEATDSTFWVSGKQSRWSTTGEASKGLTPDGIQVPDENGSNASLGSYYGKTLILTLPGDLTVGDIGAFGIWDEKFATSYASVEIPDMVNLPPSRGMLQIDTKPITRLVNTEESKKSSYSSDNLLNSALLSAEEPNQNNYERPVLDLQKFLPPKITKNQIKRANSNTDFQVNSSTDGLIDFQVPPVNRNKDNIEADTKTNGRTLTKINGKWFYLIPTDSD